MEFRDYIRDVPDFPVPNIVFKDITPLLASSEAFGAAIEQLAAPFEDSGISAVAAIEARGFMFGPPMAQLLGVGFIPIRKPGKLPYDVIGVDYDLEYGTDRVEMHIDACAEGDRVLLVDDVLATGGTLNAAASLVQSAGAAVAGIAVLIDLVGLGGAERLPSVPFHSLIEID